MTHRFHLPGDRSLEPRCIAVRGLRGVGPGCLSMNVQWAALCVACARAKDLPCLGELPADVGVGDEGSESVALVAGVEGSLTQSRREGVAVAVDLSTGVCMSRQHLWNGQYDASYEAGMCDVHLRPDATPKQSGRLAKPANRDVVLDYE